MGFHVTPCHFYQPVPTLRELKDGPWKKPQPAVKGIEFNEQYQITFLNTVCAQFKHEYDAFGLRSPAGDLPYFACNGSFGEIDGDVLYCMIRHFKPARVIEVGSGWSTLLSAYALKKNAQESGRIGELIAIEPYPRLAFLRDPIMGPTRLMEAKVQEVGLDLFETLEENDILFIDSSHVVKLGSDVNWEFFEILPRLRKGVLIHFHDIFLPDEYPEEWVKRLHWFWSEMYLLRAFLMYNTAFEVLWAGNWMKYQHADLCKKMFRTEASQSLWIRKIV